MLRSSAVPTNTYRSAKGYHFAYPSGWQLAKAKDRATIGDAGSQLHKRMDLSDVDVLIHGPSSGPILSINVIVSPYIVPATQDSLGEYKKHLAQQLSASGTGAFPQNLDVKLTKVGRYDAIVATWTSYISGAGNAWEKQFFIPGMSHSFIVTCTSEADSSAVAGPIFDKILATFKIDKELPVGSSRIHEILREARSRQPEDDRIRAELQEVMARRPQSYSEFNKQCTDLRVVLGKSDAMEKRKREMLADLRAEFGDDAHVKSLFDTLSAMETASDKIEPIWRGMIACSEILDSAPSTKQDAYQSICIEPAQQQLDLVAPEINSLAQRMQTDLQRFGTSLPPDVLQAITR